MTARYVLTSVCIQSGTMTLTASLRQRLQGRERVRFVDEDGEAFEVEVDWKGGLLKGLGPYYAKRRLAANEVVLLHFRGEEVELEALPRSLPRLERPREDPKEAKEEAPKGERRRVRVTPYPKEVLFPHEPKALEPPGVTEDLRRLGFLLEGGPPGSTRPPWDGGRWCWPFSGWGRGGWRTSGPTARRGLTWPFWPRSPRKGRCPRGSLTSPRRG